MEAEINYRLLMRQGPTPGKAYDLVKEVITIGRDVSNDIVISDAEVSRTHVRLTAQAGGCLVEDLGSTNGSFVNGQRLTGQRLLRPADVLALGETVSLEFQVATDPGATVVVAQPVVEPLAVSQPRPSAAAPTEAQPAPISAPAGKSRAGIYIGLGCGCVALTLCLLMAAILAYMYWQKIGPFEEIGRLLLSVFGI